MPEYTWKALSSDGRKVSGKSQAGDMDALVEKLQAAGYLLLKAKSSRPLFAFSTKKVSRIELASFSLMLALMLRAGVTILEALRDIAEAQTHPTLRRIVSSLGEALKEGKTLSQAMQQHPKVFDEVYVHLIEAGEHTGGLTQVLEGLTETLKWQHEIAGQARRALTYPVIALVVITGVMMFLLVVVVPQIASLLHTMRVDLPWQTKMLIGLSGFLVTHWASVVLGASMLVVGGYFVARVPGMFRGAMDHLKLRTPIIGKVLKNIALARFAYVLAMLYGAGITVVDALAVVQRSVGNHALSTAVGLAREQILRGRSLSTAFGGSTLFPPMVISMLRVGEATGSLDTALSSVSALYTREARESVERLQTALQPVLTVVLGLMLGTIMLFTLGPLYESVIANARF